MLVRYRKTLRIAEHHYVYEWNADAPGLGFSTHDTPAVQLDRDALRMEQDGALSHMVEILTGDISQ